MDSVLFGNRILFQFVLGPFWGTEYLCLYSVILGSRMIFVFGHFWLAKWCSYLVTFEKLNNIHICIRSFLGSWKIFVFVFGHLLRGKTTIKACFLFPWTNFCRNLCKLSLRNFVSKVLWTVVFNHSFVNAGNCHSRLLLCTMVKLLWFAKCCSQSICCSIRKLVFCALFYMLCNLPF